MESVKTVVVEWLDWAAKYAAKDPQDFFSRRTYLRFSLVINFSYCKSWLCDTFDLAAVGLFVTYTRNNRVTYSLS